MSARRFNNKGLSLVEVVLSALMLAVVMGALYATYINANNIMSLARSKIIALVWAESLVENQKDGVSTNDPAEGNRPALRKNPSNPNPTTTVSDVALGANPVMRRIKVTISWVE